MKYSRVRFPRARERVVIHHILLPRTLSYNGNVYSMQRAVFLLRIPLIRIKVNKQGNFSVGTK